MTFEQLQNVTKNGIEDIEIVFFLPGPGNIDGIQVGRVNFQILLSDGTIENESANLLVRLTDDAPGLVHLSNLASLKNYIRTRLNNEVLP